MSVIENQPIPATIPLPTEPVFESALIKENPRANFWLGIVANEGTVLKPAEYAAAKLLRAATYIDTYSFLEDDARDSSGGETDEDDDRSMHFVAVQDVPKTPFGRVVGNLRSIRKREEHELLPVEKLFPESFADGAAPVESVEASRFIANHPDKFVQGAISLGLIRAVVMTAFMADRKPIYAVVEEPLERRFKSVGLPFERIGEPRALSEYNNTVNMALRFMPEEIIQATLEDVKNEKMITTFFATAHGNLGTGYYDGLLLNPIDRS